MKEKDQSPISRNVSELARGMAMLLFILVTVFFNADGDRMAYIFAILTALLYIPAVSHPQNANAWRVFFAFAVLIMALFGMAFEGRAPWTGLDSDWMVLPYLLVPISALVAMSLLARRAARKPGNDG